MVDIVLGNRYKKLLLLVMSRDLGSQELQQLIKAKYYLLSLLKKECADAKHDCNTVSLRNFSIGRSWGERECLAFPLLLWGGVCVYLVHAQENTSSRQLVYLE